MTFSAEHISHSYRSHKVLEDVSIRLDKGELMTILGPNGVGKTTLLKSLVGIYPGSVEILTLDGKDITNMGPRERAKVISYVPQRSHVSGSTVFESILLGRRPYISWDIAEADLDKVSETISLMGLDELSEKKVDAISGGEYQLVQIARALVQDPKVILLDEPTNNLDVSNQENVLKVLRQTVTERGLCAIMTNHDINLSARHSDRIVMLKSGRIQISGGKEVITPESIKTVYGMDVEVEIVHGNPIIMPI
ncbi:MAG: ABC transporter ATP-binding protein [Thermoplasmata archaeon]|nr:ABC transporter ATP-binding protein [Thermoplasmata archaeon]